MVRKRLSTVLNGSTTSRLAALIASLIEGRLGRKVDVKVRYIDFRGYNAGR